MPWAEALQTYTLLTIGDGIVTQVPALVIAVGTGIIVTRSASDGNLSQEVLRQVVSFPKTLLIVACALFGLLFLPGMPVVPTVALLAVLLGVAWFAYRSRASASPDAEAAVEEDSPAADDDPYSALMVHPIEVMVCPAWTPLVAGNGSLFLERIGTLRKHFAQELGMVLPKVKFRDSAKLASDRYEIYIDGALSAKGEARLDCCLAIHPNGDVRTIPGEPTRDPSYGLPALWIKEQQREAAAMAKYTLIDAQTVFITHLNEVLRREAPRLLSRAETDKILARVRKTQPSLVEELVPTVLSVSDVQKVLQNLLREKVSIRHSEAILETLADSGRHTKDVGQLTEFVRQRLGQAICRELLGSANFLQVMTIDPAIEGRFLQGMRTAQAEPGGPVAAPIDPRMAEQFVAKLAQLGEKMMKQNLLPVLLCAPELRRQVRTLSERVMPHLRVLSMTEVPQTIELRSYGVVSLS
jgi:flagellar biosynthesis protein FlhA